MLQLIFTGKYIKRYMRLNPFEFTQQVEHPLADCNYPAAANLMTSGCQQSMHSGSNCFTILTLYSFNPCANVCRTITVKGPSKLMGAGCSTPREPHSVIWSNRCWTVMDLHLQDAVDTVWISQICKFIQYSSQLILNLFRPSFHSWIQYMTTKYSQQDGRQGKEHEK